MRNGQLPNDEWPTPRGRLTRARIIDTAADLFTRQGVAGTSVEDIRRAAGVSGSQMTHYFRSKQGLIRAVIILHAEAAIESLEQTGHNRFRTLADLRSWTYDATAPEGPVCRLGILAGELIQPDPQTQAELALCFERWAAAVRQALEELRCRGVLRRDADPQALAYGLLAALHGGTLITGVVQNRVPLDGAANAMLTHIRSLCIDEPVTGPEGDTSPALG